MDTRKVDLSKSSNWDEVEKLFQKGKPTEKELRTLFPERVFFPQMYGGQEYEILTFSGEKYKARVDDSREYMSEGLEWKKLSEPGNLEMYYVVAWKLLLRT